MSLYSFITLFIKIYSSWIITESIKALEIKTSMLFNLSFANYIILLYFVFFFLIIIDLYFLLPAATAKIINPIAELVIPIGIPTNEAKAEMETHPVIAEA